MRVVLREAGRLGRKHTQHIWWLVEESGSRDVLRMGLDCVLLVVLFAHGSALALLITVHLH